MSGLDQILPKLSQLTADELSSLRSRISALASLGGVSFTNSNADLVLEAICDYLTSKGLEHPYPNQLRKSPQYRSFANKCDAVILYLGTKVRIEQRALLALGVDLLYKNLGDIGIAVTSRTMMAHIHRLPACMNRAFPGYAANGHLSFVIRRGR